MFRIAAFLIRFPIMVLEYVGRASFYSIWYLIFFVLCIFRPFTGFMVIGAIVAMPIGIVVWEHPDAANGIPFWAFPLASIVTVGLALGYNIFVDWLTPPGATDPGEHFRKPFREP